MQVVILIFVLSFLPVVYFYAKLALMKNKRVPTFRTKVIFSDIKMKFLPFKQKIIKTGYIDYGEDCLISNNICKIDILLPDQLLNNKIPYDIVLNYQFIFFKNTKKDNESLLKVGIILDKRFKSYILRYNIPIYICVLVNTKLTEKYNVYFCVPKNYFHKMKLVGFFDNIAGQEK